jgi:chitin synthase
MRQLKARGTQPVISRSGLHHLTYRALTGDDVDSIAGVPSVASADTLSVCLTAYNEELSAYHVTLDALARNVDYLLRAGQQTLSQNAVICIVVDGLENMSAKFAEYAEKLGIYQPALLSKEADYHLFETVIERRLLQLPPDQLMKDLVARDRTRHPRFGKPAEEHVKLQKVVLFIKQENRGKLDSHRCYFEILCSPRRPAYFLQIDVGTAPHDRALFDMWAQMASGKNLAAVSARSHMPMPDGPRDLLGAWQYGDIAGERILLWPTELMMGYMSVLSGQLCLTRAESIWRDAPKISVVPQELPEARSPRPHVIESYFRGLDSLGPFETNMFLAEDRILGLEIVFQPDSRWELGYVPQAGATIDKCDTWNELLCQRRRWTCSSIACRLWLFTRIRDYLSSRNRTALQKSRILLAAVFHTLYLVLQWLVPAFSLMIYGSVHAVMRQSVLDNSTLVALIDVAYGGVIALLAAQIVISARGALNRNTNRFFSVSIVYQMSYLVAGSAAIVLGNLASPAMHETAILFVAMIVSLLSVAHLYAKDIVRGLGRSLFNYVFSRPAIAFTVMTHSALNSHNTSWGTKGLNRPQYLDDDVDPLKYAQTKYHKKDFDGFRVKVVLTMLIANGFFYAFASQVRWTRSLTGVKIVLGLLLAQIIMALSARLVFWWTARSAATEPPRWRAS